MKTLERQERNQLLKQISILEQLSFGPEGDSLSVEQRRSIGAQRKELKKTYFNRLPRVPIARCPFTDNIVTKAMDIYGLDGEWWNGDSRDFPAEGSPYLVTYLGALNLSKGLNISSGIEEISLGPEVPYVIPRLLEIPNVKCVIYSTTILEPEYPVYFMSYFAKPKLPPAQSHQMWLRDSFYYVDENGNNFWYSCDDIWDFDLAPWIEKSGHILWIRPDDSEMRLCSEPPSDFPYFNLKGRQKFLSIQNGRLLERPLPSGMVVDSDVFE